MNKKDTGNADPDKIYKPMLKNAFTTRPRDLDCGNGQEAWEAEI